MSCECRDSCGCLTERVPRLGHANRPGLPSLSYRLGTHGVFLERMLSRIPLQGVDDEGQRRPLAALKTRSPDDPTVAFLDAAAMVADVLAFYQERVANEGFLRTATERRSVLELARAIGYELNPGVSASTWLAFTMEDAKGAPPRARIAKGTRVQSVPGQDESSQTFETMAPIEARVDWNAMRLRLTRPQTLSRATTSVLLKGADLRLEPGDALLFIYPGQEQDLSKENWDLRRLVKVAPDAKAGLTRVSWNEPLGWTSPAKPEPPKQPLEYAPSYGTRVFVMRQRASLFGHNAPDWATTADVTKMAAWKAANPGATTGAPVLNANGSVTPPTPPGNWGNDWPRLTIGGVATVTGAGSPPAITPPDPPLPQDVERAYVHLDLTYPKVLKGSWVVLSRPGYSELCLVDEAIESAVSGFALSGKSTRLLLRGEKLAARFDAHLRALTAFIQSEPLELAEEPIPEPVTKGPLELDRVVPDLRKGQRILLQGKRARVRLVGMLRDDQTLVSADGTPSPTPPASGDVFLVLERPVPLKADAPQGDHAWRLRDAQGFEGTLEAPAPPGAFEWLPADKDDPVVSESFAAAGASEDNQPTRIYLDEPLQRAYDRATVELCANVVEATHGESLREVLGSGDGRLRHQRFRLRKSRLSHEPAPTARGGTPALTVRVNDVEWREVPSLHGVEPHAEVYAIRIDDDAFATIQFGDGQDGARLPTGSENVTAAYRTGLGRAGNLPTGALRLLADRPLGVKGVVNPVPAVGGEDPERLADARDKAPVTVLTLERIVSLQDHEDFANAFNGVGKAKAEEVDVRGERVVFVTVADNMGRPLAPDTTLARNLRLAMDDARDHGWTLHVAGHEPRAFRIKLRLAVDERHVKENVHKAVRLALAQTFLFTRRRFAQFVTAAEILAAAQRVDGVVAADLDELTFVGHAASAGGPPAFLEAGGAAFDPDGDQGRGAFRPAQLLVLDHADLDDLKGWP